MGCGTPYSDLARAVKEIYPLLTVQCVSLRIYATSQAFSFLQEEFGAFSSQLVELVETPEEITMDDSPLYAVRRKRASSMVQGILDLKKKAIDALISAGNTGALIAAATMFLDHLPGVQRPSLMAILPTIKGTLAVCDVGGIIYCQSSNLVQFAFMGAIYQKCVNKIDPIRVGLLNIGQEEYKGTHPVKETYRLFQEFLQNSSLNSFFTFRGNIEGRAAFMGEVDVLITDGFTGNVFLKTAEGVSHFLIDYIQQEIKDKKLQGAEKMLGDLYAKADYSQYPGAIVSGIDGLVLKCHGASDFNALKTSIKGAIRLIECAYTVNVKKEYEAISPTIEKILASGR